MTATATTESATATLTTVKKRLVDLTPADYNPNDMTDAELRQLGASLLEFGYVEPVIVNKRSGNIVGGHQRVRCLLARGTVEFIECVEVDLTDEDERTLNVALNTIRGTQDRDRLAALLAELTPERRTMAGFDADRFDDLLSKQRERLQQGESDPDAMPEGGTTRAKAGDLFMLGDHRLLCGDSVGSHAIHAFRGEDDAPVNADCVFTSPPYGVGIDYGPGYQDTFENACATIAAMPDVLAQHVVEGGFIVVNFNDIAAHGKRGSEYPMSLVYYPAFINAGWRLWSRRLWCKKQGAAVANAKQCIQTNRAAPDFEYVWTFKRQSERKSIRRQTRGEYASQLGWFSTANDPNNDIDRDTHGGSMPVEAAQRMIASHSRKGGIVLDPFAGTGTTLIACQTLDRVCYAVEQNPPFVDVILRRWEKFTGSKATKVT